MLVIHFVASKIPEIKSASQETHSDDAPVNTRSMRNLTTPNIPGRRISAEQRYTCMTQASAVQASLSVPGNTPPGQPTPANLPCFLAQLISWGERPTYSTLCLNWLGCLNQPTSSWELAHDETSPYLGHQQQGVFSETETCHFVINFFLTFYVIL